MKAGNLNRLIPEVRWNSGEEIPFVNLIRSSAQMQKRFPSAYLLIKQRETQEQKPSYVALEKALYEDVVLELVNRVKQYCSKHSIKLISEDYLIQTCLDFRYWNISADIPVAFHI